MPARDIYHDTVVQALIADGWQITDDPLLLTYGGRSLYVDIDAERSIIAAEREGQKIAVEVKSFLSPSPMRDLQEAVGQYGVYRSILLETQPDRSLYLAISQRVYESVFTEKLGQLILKSLQIQLLVFDEEKTRKIRWIP